MTRSTDDADSGVTRTFFGRLRHRAELVLPEAGAAAGVPSPVPPPGEEPPQLTLAQWSAIHSPPLNRDGTQEHLSLQAIHDLTGETFRPARRV